jgi:hypothetical protein
MKLIGALETSGVELIGDGAISQGGGRGVRLKASAKDAQKTPQPRPDEDSTPPGPRAA